MPAAPEKQLDGAYTVKAGDTLWDLAETYLGDGSRYPEIHGATGPLTTDVIQIGQQLFLTPAATGAEVAPPAPSPNSAAETPAAESSAPTPEIAPELVPEPAPQPAPELVPDVAVSPTAAAPEAPTAAAPQTPEVPVSSAPSEVAGEQSPLVVPDVSELQELVPGGDEMAQAEARAAEEAAARIFGIEIPGAPAAEAAEPSVAEAPATEPAPQPAPPVSVDVPARSEAPDVAPAPAPAIDENSAPASAPTAPGAPDSTISQSEQFNTPEIAPELTPEPTPETGAQQATPADTQAPETLVPLNTTAAQLPENAATTTALTSTDNAQDSKTVMGLSALAGIALLAGVGLFRRRQQNRRRRGERIPMPKESTALVEQQIREIADPSLLDLLDNALRDVADICRTNSIPLPALLGVFLHDRSIELALLDDIELPAPWQRDRETSAWTITADDELDPR
ncbi:hypothetical protein QV65_33265 [Rhodococcus erythropolis]|nr:hypothetical protein QV65_33265 [Rhodococcus erythropolis]